MPDVADGLRERKKRRTRAMLIEAAADLCLRNGYDNTTVEQIAAAAEVAPRTFSRYFPNKECVVASITDDLDELIADAMERQPDGITVYDALLRSSVQVLAGRNGSETPGFRRIALLIEIINGASSFRASALALRHDVTNRATMGVMARRMGVPEGDRAVTLVTDTWAVIFSDSFAGLGRPGNDPIRPDVICDRLSASVEVFRRTWSPWNPSSSPASQPHTSAPEG